MLTRLKIAFTTAVLIGLIIGLQQSIPIIISSFYNLNSFPYLSLVAIIFVITLSIASFLIFLSIVSFLIKLFPQTKHLPSSIQVSSLTGLAVTAWVSIFLYYKLIAFFQSYSILLLPFLAITAVIGILTGLTIYSTIKFLTQTPKLNNHTPALSFWLPRFSLSLLASLIAFLVYNYCTSLQTPVGFSPKASSTSSNQTTNVILITLDALRADSLTPELMPHTYAFAEKYLNFAHAYSPAPWTPPSFESLFSMQDPGAIGSSTYNFSLGEVADHHHLPNQLTTFVEQLHSSGYLTQAIITNKHLTFRRGFDQGFDGFIDFEEIMPYHWHFHTRDMTIIRFIRELPLIKIPIKDVYETLVGKTAENAFRTRANMISNTALQWLAYQNSQPFFLWLHYIEPHSPHNPIKAYSPELPADITPQQEQILREIGVNFSIEEIRWRDVYRQQFKALYDGENRYADFQLNRVLEYLQNQPYYDNTLIIISSDHGEEFFDHGKIGHGKSLYNELVRVPLVLKPPHNSRSLPQISDQLVSNMDLGSTILDLLQISSFPDRNWFSQTYPQTIFVEAPIIGPELKAAVQLPWKLIYNPQDESYHLYDMETDPQEQKDVASQYPQIVNQLSTFIQNRVASNLQFYRQFSQTSGFQAVQDFGEVVGY
jgi:arylsulfatase A-like enzyme